MGRSLPPARHLSATVARQFADIPTEERDGNCRGNAQRIYNL